jgi:hypothetical protein
MKIGRRAFDLIVREEVSSEAYYTRHYQHPEWPGGLSGITIGIGYDLGYASVTKITSDWRLHVSSDMLNLMIRCAGIKGSDARALLPNVQSFITIPWSAAIEVFATRDVPQWTAAVCRALPNTEKLTPDCLGVIVSIAYNRGASFSLAGDRYTEMRNIKAHMNGMVAAIPSDIISMKRLWPNVVGLRNRRDHEAALFQLALIDLPGSEATVADTPTVPDDTPLKAGPARTKPPATTAAQHGTAGAIVAGSVASAHAAGFSLTTVIMVGIGSAIVASVIWWLWYRQRNPS